MDFQEFSTQIDILNVDFALELCNYTSLKRVIYVSNES